MQNQTTAEAKALENEFIAALQNRQKLDSQFKENEIVFQELERAELESHQVYKMVGKILLRQENRDAIENVAKRIDFIKSEMKKIDARLDTYKEKYGKFSNKSLGLDSIPPA